MIYILKQSETLVCLMYMTWFTAREDFVETLIFLHVVCTLHFMSDDIYLTAIGLTPGGYSTVHIYTQTVYRTTQLDVRISYEHSNVLSLPDVITCTFIRNSKQLSEHLSNRTDDHSTSSPPLYVPNFFHSGATQGNIHIGCTETPILSSCKLRNLRLLHS
jgi:hypothetical protein